MLCADHGGTLMKGSSPGAGINTLFISDAFSTATPYSINSATSAVYSGSHCGALVHNQSQPGWAGPQCSYVGGITRPAVCPHVRE